MSRGLLCVVAVFAQVTDRFKYAAYAEFFRDYYADPKRDTFQIDLCGQDIRINQDGRLQLGLGITCVRFTKCTTLNLCASSMLLTFLDALKKSRSGGRVWDAAVVLAKFLEHNASATLGLGFSTPVLELGAGCGLAGMRDY